MILLFHTQIPSGKNQIQLARRGTGIHKYPNKRFAAWRDAVECELVVQRIDWTREERSRLPLRGDICLTLRYHPLDKRTRDISGMLDALFHVLMHSGIIVDDGQIRGVTWEYPWATSGPCVTVTLEERIA